MSASKTSRIALVVLAFAAVALVIVLGWPSQPNDTVKGAEKGARIQRERARAPLALAPKDKEGGDDANQPQAEASRTPRPAERSLYDRLGGRAAIYELMGKLLDALQHNDVMMANARVQAAAAAVNAGQLHLHLTNFVCKATGGPDEYTGRTMEASHAHLEITPAEWDAMSEDFAYILADMEVPAREAQELTALIDTLEDEIVTAR